MSEDKVNELAKKVENIENRLTNVESRLDDIQSIPIIKKVLVRSVRRKNETSKIGADTKKNIRIV